MRIRASRPRKVDASRLVTSACSGAFRVARRRRDVLEQHVEQRVEVRPGGHLAVGRLLGARNAGAAGGVQRRQAQRVLGGLGGLVVQVGGDVEQQVVAGLHHLGDPGVRPVGLVDHQDHRQVRGQRLAQHEPGLRQRPLRGVDQQQHPVHHGQPALHLAAEVGVPGGVDDVDDRDAAVGVVAVHGGVLGQDGDALFPSPGHRCPGCAPGCRRRGGAAPRTAAASRPPGWSCRGRRGRRWRRCEMARRRFWQRGAADSEPAG